MGKNNNSRNRRLVHKKEINKTNQYWKRIEEASKVLDPTESFVSFKTFSKNDLSLKISCLHQQDVTDERLQWIFELTKKQHGKNVGFRL